LTTLAFVAEKLALLDQQNSQATSFRMQWQFFSVSPPPAFGWIRSAALTDERPGKCVLATGRRPCQAPLTPLRAIRLLPGCSESNSATGVIRPSTTPTPSSAIFHYNSSSAGMPPTAFHYTPGRLLFAARTRRSILNCELPAAPQAPQNEHLQKKGEGWGHIVTFANSILPLAASPATSAFIPRRTAVCFWTMLRARTQSREVHS
jgi:hypothetical protein